MVAVVFAGLASAYLAHLARLQRRIAALNNQEIAIRAAQAAYDNARLTREVAEIAVVEYKEGIFKQEWEAAQGEIALSKSDLERAKDELEWAKRIERKGYAFLITKSPQLAYERAKFALDQAVTKRNVLENYTKDKTIKELESEVASARANELAKKAILELEKTKLKRMMAETGN
jgi:hypothetical protein